MSLSLSDTDSALERVRNSSQFFLKLDFAVLASILAIASLFKLDGYDLLAELTNYRVELKLLGVIIAYALVLEYFITLIRNELPRRARKEHYGAVVTFFNYAYFLQVLSHLLLVGYLVGLTSGLLDCLSSSTCGGT